MAKCFLSSAFGEPKAPALGAQLLQTKKEEKQ
jgi:hypothetical protein